MASTKERMAQFQKLNNPPPATNTPMFGQAGLKPVSKNNVGPPKPVELEAKVGADAKPAEQTKLTPAIAAKPGEQLKPSNVPETAKPTDQIKTIQGKYGETSKVEAKPVQPQKQDQTENAVPPESLKLANTVIKTDEQQKSTLIKPDGNQNLIEQLKPVEQPKPTEQPKPAEKSKSSEQLKPIEQPAGHPTKQSKPVEQPKPSEQLTLAEQPAGQPKPTEQPKPAEQSKPAENSKPFEQLKPIEKLAGHPTEQPKSAEKSKLAEQSKPAELSKPAEKSKPAEQSKPSDQLKPIEQPTGYPKSAEKPNPIELPKSTEQPKPTQLPKPIDQNKLGKQSADQKNPSEQLKSDEQTNKPSHSTGLIKPEDLVIDQAKQSKRQALAEPTSQQKSTDQLKPNVSNVQTKPLETKDSTTIVSTTLNKVEQQPKINVASVQIKANVQTTATNVTRSELQQAVKVEPAKSEVVQKPIEVSKLSDKPSKLVSNETKLSSPDELFANIFYFSGMGNLIGSALAEGIYVSEKNHNSALELDDIEAVKKREEEKRKHEIINTARNQAHGLFGDFQKLQALLEGLPTFTDTFEPRPLERRAIDHPIHGHIYFQRDQQTRPHSQHHQSGSENVVPSHRQTTTFTSSQIIQPSVNASRIDVSRFSERSTVSSLHATPSREVSSFFQEVHMQPGSSYDRFDAKQAALGPELVKKATSDKPYDIHMNFSGLQNFHDVNYPTIEPEFSQTKYVEHRASRTDDASHGHPIVGTLDTTDLKLWQLSHLRGLEAKGYHLESHTHSPPHQPLYKSHPHHTQPATSLTSFSPNLSYGLDLPYCDL